MEKLKVLVVEDDKTTQKLYDRFLSEEIFDRNFTKSGEEALDIYRTWQPEVIILALMLLEISGYTVLKEIREDLGDKGIPIIICSNLYRKDDILSCVKLGVQGYLRKSINWNNIGLRVLECFQKAHPQMADRVTELKKELGAKHIFKERSEPRVEAKEQVEAKAESKQQPEVEEEPKEQTEAKADSEGQSETGAQPEKANA